MENQILYSNEHELWICENCKEIAAEVVLEPSDKTTTSCCYAEAKNLIV